MEQVLVDSRFVDAAKQVLRTLFMVHRNSTSSLTPEQAIDFAILEKHTNLGPEFGYFYTDLAYEYSIAMLKPKDERLNFDDMTAKLTKLPQIAWVFTPMPTKIVNGAAQPIEMAISSRLLSGDSEPVVIKFGEILTVKWEREVISYTEVQFQPVLFMGGKNLSKNPLVAQILTDLGFKTRREDLPKLEKINKQAA